MLDNNKNTYWTTDDDINTGAIEIEFTQPKKVSYILLQEYIKLGQRIKGFNIEVLKNNEWHQVADATTIGYKRILKIDPVTTERIRINISDSKACPVISNVEVY